MLTEIKQKLNIRIHGNITGRVVSGQKGKELFVRPKKNVERKQKQKGHKEQHIIFLAQYDEETRKQL